MEKDIREEFFDFLEDEKLLSQLRGYANMEDGTNYTITCDFIKTLEGAINKILNQDAKLETIKNVIAE